MSTWDAASSMLPGEIEQQIAALVQRGEAAYAAMYDCRSAALHDLCDDALERLARAARLAGEAGDVDRAIALTARCRHLRAVYRQLRS